MEWLMKFAAVVPMSLIAGATLAADASRPYERPLTKEEARFRALDRNNDQKLSQAEFQVDATATLEFTVLDTDHDGSLSMSEFISRPIPPAKATETKEDD